MAAALGSLFAAPRRSSGLSVANGLIDWLCTVCERYIPQDYIGILLKEESDYGTGAESARRYLGMKDPNRARWRQQSQTNVESDAGRCTIEVWYDAKKKEYVARVDGTWGPMLDNSGTGKADLVLLSDKDMLLFGADHGTLMVNRVTKGYTGVLRLAPGSPPSYK
jgi:hypothetical protein